MLAWAVAVACAAVATWKPWVEPQVTPGSIAAAVASFGLGWLALGAASAPVSAVPPVTPVQPAGMAQRSSSNDPALRMSSSAVVGPGTTTVLGLDWGADGGRDHHDGWGMALAALPLGQLDDVLASRRSVIRPAVRWVAATPGVPTAARVGPQGTPVVALVLTWPSNVTPVDVMLSFIGPLPTDGQRSRLIDAPGGQVPLRAPVPFLLRLATPRGHDYLDATAGVSYGLISGTYFLPPDAAVTRISDWLDQAWPPGSYEFGVQLADGRGLALPFKLDSGV